MFPYSQGIAPVLNHPSTIWLSVFPVPGKFPVPGTRPPHGLNTCLFLRGHKGKGRCQGGVL